MHEEEPLNVRAIINILGKPKEHIEQLIKEYVKKLGKENGVKVIDEQYAEAEKVVKDDIFSTFAELEIEFKDVPKLVWFCFDYMPSSVEIVHPEKIMYRSTDFTAFLNDHQGKLHRLNMMIENLSAENKVMKKNSLTLIKNIIQLQLRDGKKDSSALSKGAGVPENQLAVFLKEMAKEGKIIEENGLYAIKRYSEMAKSSIQSKEGTQPEERQSEEKQ